MNVNLIIEDEGEEILFNQDLTNNSSDDSIIKEHLILNEDLFDEEMISLLPDVLNVVDINLSNSVSNYLIGTTKNEEVQSTELISGMSSYMLNNEAKLVSDRYNKIQRLMQIANNEISSGEAVYRNLYKFLESSSCSAIPNKTYVFLSNKYKTKGNFQVHLVNAFINLQQMNEDNNIHLNYESVWEEILDILKEERIKFSEQRLKEMKIAVKNFGAFFEVTYSTFKSKIPDSIKVLDYVNISSPSLVVGDGYICECGSFVETKYPPLSVLITKSQGRYVYNLINNPVVCDCKRVLALPEVIVNALEPLIVKEVENIETSIKVYAIYRLPIEEIIPIIPSNLKYFFDLKNDISNVIDVSVGGNGNLSEYYYNYVSLVKYLMSNKENIINLNEVSKIKRDLEVIPNISYISNVFNSIEINLNIEVDLSNYVKTLLHYLDTLGCFALTPKSFVQYEYYKLNKINRKCFSVEYALSWLYDNAWALSGLNIIVFNSILSDIELLPEYIPVINYIYMLRILSLSDKFNISSGLKSWLSNPSTDASIKFIKSTINKRENSEQTNIITSLRDLRNNNISFNPKSFRNLFYLLQDIYENRYLYDKVMRYNPELDDRLVDSFIDDEGSFFNVEEIEKNCLIESTLNFNEFSDVFKKIGKYIFFTSISSIKIIEISKIINLLNSNGNIEQYFLLSDNNKNNLKSLLIKKNYEEEYMNKLLQDVIFLSDNNLPEDVLNTRDSLSTQEFISFVNENKLEILENCDLIQIYPEVFK